MKATYLAAVCLVVVCTIAARRYAARHPLSTDTVDIRSKPRRRLPFLRKKRKLRLAIACMTKKPLAFDFWLRHHFDVIGAHRVYIRAENSRNELQALLRGEPRIAVEYSDGGKQAYFTQMDRQAAFVNGALQQARADGCTHLLHIDDDELLHCPFGVQAFHDELGGMDFDCVKVRNIEAVYGESECTNPFSGTHLFVTKPSKFTAYINGKSIANLTRSTRVQSLGPHLFSGSSQTISSSLCVVLHFESSCLDRWRAKFRNYATDSPDACDSGRIPFPFYCESMRDPSDEVWRRWKSPQRHKDDDSLVAVSLRDPRA